MSSVTFDPRSAPVAVSPGREPGPRRVGGGTINPALPKLIPTAIAVGLALLIWFVIPVPAKVSPNAWHLFALFIGTIVAIILKAMPIGSLSVVAIALVALTQVTNPGKPAAALTDALSGFANPLIWLIVLAVLVALSLN